MAKPSIGLHLVVRNAPDVHEQPHVVLTDWQVFDDGQACYLAGLLPNGHTLRVTTAVKSVRVASRTWITSSGRVYKTQGPPASDSALMAMLERMATALRGRTLKTCSDEFEARFSSHVTTARGQEPSERG